MSEKSDMIQLGGLWKSKSQSGNDYLSGNFSYGAKIMVFKNGYKQKDNDPDYVMYLAKKEKKEDGGSPAQETPAPAPRDDLPF